MIGRIGIVSIHTWLCGNELASGDTAFNVEVVPDLVESAVGAA